MDRPHWTMAVLHLDRPSCNLARRRDGSRVVCQAGRGPGDPGVAFSDHGVPMGWEPVLSLQRGMLIRPGNSGAADCSTCPLMQLPDDVHPLRVEVDGVAGGVRMEVAMPSQRLDQLLEVYRSSGQGPRLVRLGRGETGHVDVLRTVVDLGELTARQVEAIRFAQRFGYFHGDADVSDLAKAMGCSRSTAHEHLRKGLARMVEAVFA